MSESVLVVSASTGSGHVQAGQALEEAFNASDIPVAVEHVDLLKLAPRWIKAAVGGGYELIATRTPRVWDELYRRTDLPSPDLARWGPVVHRALFGEFRRLLQSRRWSGCLCTHFLPGQLAAGTPGAPPFGMVVTDLTLHHVWAQPRVGHYFVPNQQLASALRARVPSTVIEVTGVPVARRFAAPNSPAEARAALRLHPHEPVVLVVGGGMGVGMDWVAAAVANADIQNLHVVAICGRNAAAAASLQELARLNSRLHVRGFVPDIEQYIAAADLVVTKPGGVTTSEVLSIGRPLVLSRAIPGQEEGNARYLCAAGVATYAPTAEALRFEVESLFRHAQTLQHRSAMSRTLGRASAAREVADSFLARLRARRAA